MVNHFREKTLPRKQQGLVQAELQVTEWEVGEMQYTIYTAYLSAM